jgi:hypothetical protein
MCEVLLLFLVNIDLLFFPCNQSLFVN